MHYNGNLVFFFLLVKKCAFLCESHFLCQFCDKLFRFTSFLFNFKFCFVALQPIDCTIKWFVIYVLVQSSFFFRFVLPLISCLMAIKINLTATTETFQCKSQLPIFRFFSSFSYLLALDFLLIGQTRKSNAFLPLRINIINCIKCVPVHVRI